MGLALGILRPRDLSSWAVVDVGKLDGSRELHGLYGKNQIALGGLLEARHAKSLVM